MPDPTTTPRLTAAEVEAMLALGRLVPQSRQPWQSEWGLVIDAARKVLPLARDLLDARAALAAVYAALDHGDDADVWPTGLTAAEAVERALSLCDTLDTRAVEAEAKAARLERELAAFVVDRDEQIASVLATAGACEEECERLSLALDDALRCVGDDTTTEHEDDDVR